MKLTTPKGDTTRPTSAKSRESLINMLQDEIREAFFVDLFAGSGAVGLSALSRGAGGCLFVERDKDAFAALEKNLKEATRRAKNGKVEIHPFVAIKKDISGAWSEIKRFGPVDILWADPPYAETNPWLSRELGLISESLSESGILALESSVEGKEEMFKLLEGWDLLKERKFGGTLLSIWRKPENEVKK